MSYIEFKNLNFSYEGFREEALKNFNFEINKGEFVVLIGKSGCGKSTVTRLLNGTIPSFFKGKLSGEVVIDGENARNINNYELANKVGSIFQNPRTQFFNIDTDSELAFGLENRGEDADRINERIDEVTAMLKLEALRNRDIFELSGGEMQKIAFASIYAMSPDIYVLDEPSSNLDEGGIEDLRKNLSLVKKEGKTVVVAEHRLYYLMDLADRFVFMEEGTVKAIYTADELRIKKDSELDEMGLRSAEYVYLKEEPLEFNSNEDAKDTEGLSLVNLTTLRSKRVISSNINLNMKPGEIYGIMGPNGIGKTTLLRCIAGLHKEYKGEILVDGKSMKSADMRKRSYLVMQDVNYQLFGESVESECRLGLRNVTDSSVKDALEKTGLETFAARHPNTLSGGQKQRLSVAVSMVSNRDIITFDEPTSGLDRCNMKRIVTIMKELAAAGKYLIVVSHDNEFLNSCCDILIQLQGHGHNSVTV